MNNIDCDICGFTCDQVFSIVDTIVYQCPNCGKHQAIYDGSLCPPDDSDNSLSDTQPIAPIEIQDADQPYTQTDVDMDSLTMLGAQRQLAQVILSLIKSLYPGGNAGYDDSMIELCTSAQMNIELIVAYYEACIERIRSRIEDEQR